ncbi:putative cytochrome P450 [Mycena venus]|uniref:Putative cytochrome P450 n=1 Tax=Mycena venus TaxID=2733690 RepID=A0A8H6YWQ1_9AGAR|nr:putative cytochrome P450 [Mycena venus]
MPGFLLGPPTVPLLGNAHIFPTAAPHYKFTEWARQYGGIYSLKLGTSTVVVLTDAVAARELLDKQSETTSDRPKFYIAELVTQGKHMTVSHYNSTWKTMRKAVTTILTQKAVAEHLPIQYAEAIHLAYNLLRAPQDFYTEVQRFSHSVILSVIYGKRAPRYDAPQTAQFFHVLREWNALAEPGSSVLIDFFPILKLVPERWAKWKRQCMQLRRMQRAMYSALLGETEDRLRRGEENGSYMEVLLGRQKELNMDDEMKLYFGATMLEAGSDTTSIWFQTFFLILAANSDAQKKAQSEIDRVVGEDRMPTLDDLEHMPYVRALILEMHRFRPNNPLSIPHCTQAPREYNGYVIPPGTMIIVNLWGIFQDPELYEDPEKFFPDRYLITENGTKPGVDASALRHNLPFGHGRRICPGIHLAESSININVMNLLWAFDVKPETDAAGNPIPVDTLAYLGGLAPAPAPFKCKITPRTAAKAKIIEREYLAATETFSKFEVGLSPEEKEFVARSRVPMDF